jgi:hypothetical protein
MWFVKRKIYFSAEFFHRCRKVADGPALMAHSERPPVKEFPLPGAKGRDYITLPAHVKSRALDRQMRFC